MSFLDVITGNPTRSVDINQLIDALNGTVASQIKLLSTANTAYALAGNLPSAPGSDQPVLQAAVSGDSTDRLSAYIRSSDGYGGVRGGAGASITAHFYAGASGWNIPESLGIAGGLTVGGTLSGAGASFSGSLSAASLTGSLAASNVGSGYPAASLGAGTLPGGVTVPAANVSGDLANATIPAANIDAGTSGSSFFAVNAENLASNAGGSPILAAGYVSAQNKSFANLPNSNGSMVGFKQFSGTGAGTYSIGMQFGPNFVGITTTQANSTQTMGVDSISASSVHCNMPNSWPFVGLCTIH